MLKRVSLGFILSVLFLSTFCFAQSWWDTSWSYRRGITLSSTTSLDDYQVKIELSPANTDNYAHILPNGDDIRFTGSDGTTLQDYWIEKWDNTGTSTIWVEIKDSGTDKLYMYYGNPSASSASDGGATFEFFDDFEDGDISDWTNAGEGGGEIENSIVYAGNYAMKMASPRGYVYKSFSSISSDRVFEWMARDAYTSYYSDYGIHANVYDWTNSIDINFKGDGNIGNCDGAYTTICTYSADTWYNLKDIIHPSSDTHDIYVYNDDGSLRGSLTSASTRGTVNSFNGFALYVGNNGDTIYIDNVFMRKYTSPEPTYSIGMEETSGDTAPPLWRNQGTNDIDNIISVGGAINLTAQGYDETALDWAWLSTNETGAWKNYTGKSWWNSSYSYRMPINCTNMSDKVPLVINGSSGFSISGNNQIVWTYCSGTTYLYYNNYTDYVVANNTERLPMEVEWGNGSNYLSTTVWTYFEGDSNNAVWHFNETSGSVINSSMSTMHGGVLGGGTLPVWTTDDAKFGYGMYFDGSSSSLCTDASMAGWQRATIMFWHTFTASGQDILAMQGDSSTYETPWIGYTSADGSAYMFSMSQGGAVPTVFDDGVSLPTTLTMVTHTWDGSNMRLYVNDELKETKGFSQSSLDPTPSENFCSGNLFMGHGYADGAAYRYSQVTLDEFRIFNRSLSIEIISEIYNNSVGYAGFGDLGAEQAQKNYTAGGSGGTWWNDSWSKRKCRNITTYTENDIIIIPVGNDSNINSSAGYPQALRLTFGDDTEYSHWNWSYEAAAVYSLMTIANTTGQQEWCVYYGNSGANYPDYTDSGSWSPYVYTTTYGQSGVDVYDDFEDGSISDDWGWNANGYSMDTLMTAQSDQALSGTYSMRGDGVNYGATVGWTASELPQYVGYWVRQTGTHGNVVRLSHQYAAYQGILINDVGTGGADMWAWYVPDWTTTGHYTPLDTWQSIYLELSNSNNKGVLKIDGLPVGTANYYNTGTVNGTNFDGMSANNFWIDLYISSRNPFNLTATRPVYDEWRAEEAGSSTVYNSPRDMNDAAATWTWSNFTWQNTSITTDKTIGWRIYYNDTSGNINVTDIQTFYIGATASIIHVFQPENKTYSTNSVPIVYSIDSPNQTIIWQYNRNGTNYTATDNTTLLTFSGNEGAKIFEVWDGAEGDIDYSITYFTVDTTAPTTTYDKIEMISGGYNLIFLNVTNTDTDEDVLTLRISGGDNLITSWSWFEGYRYTENSHKLDVTLDSGESIEVPIAVFGGPEGTYNPLRIQIESHNTGTISDVNLTVNTVNLESGFSHSVPGLTWLFFSLVILAGSLVYAKKAL